MSSRKSPAISVVMSVYNSATYLKDAIESILDQTFEDFEFIIIDDGSTDNSVDIIKSYKDRRIVFLQNYKNIGLAKSLNKGISIARGKYIARMDADDISVQDRLKVQIDFINSNDTDIVFSTISFIDENNKELGYWVLDANNINLDDIYATLPYSNCLAHPTMMAKRNIIRNYRYDETLDKAQDYNLWLRLLANKYRFSKINIPLVKYRLHNKSVTASSNSGIEGLKKNIKVKHRFVIDEIIKKRTIDSFRSSVLRSLFGDSVSFIKHKLLYSFVYYFKKLLIYGGKICGSVYSSKINTHIFFFFPYYHMGGAEKVHLDIVGVVKNENPVVVFNYESKNNFFYDKFKSISEVVDQNRYLKSRYKRWFLVGFWSGLINRKNKPTVFGSNNYFFYDILPYLKNDVKVIDLIHAFGAEVEEYSIPYVKYITHRVLINHKTYSDLLELYKNNSIDPDLHKRVKVIENAVHVPEDYENKANRRLEVFYVGRASSEKRIDLIVKIAEICHDKKIEANITLVGDNFDKFINKDHKSYIKHFDETSNIEEVYKKADVVLITSEREGFPMAIMEAMAYGVIPVSTNVGGIGFHVKNGENGLLVPDRDEEDIVNNIVKHIKYLSENPSMRQKLSKASYRYAKEHFDKDKFVESYRKLFYDT